VTSDLGDGQFAPTGDIKFPFHFRHGSVLPVTKQEYARLQATYGQPKTGPISSAASGNAPMQPVPKPILDGFTADPAIRVFGGTYYVYPTSDKPNWLTTDFSVWSSKNLINWKKERMILDVAHGLKWANIKAWAPDCIERDGTYFFYFCADGKIGVGTAKSPAGPFVDALGKPLLDRKADPRMTTNTIDPYPFIDDDGQAYLYWGNGGERANAFRLRRDMVTIEGDIIDIPIKGRSSGGLVDFREGIVVFKRNGLYYFMWSVDDARSDNYRVAYGTAKSPLGPVEIPAGSLVLKKSGPVKGTGHHSVVNVPGTDRWYAAYHRHAIPGGSGYQRETCLARMEFNPDGTIKPMDPLAPVFAPGSPGEPVR
jgi:beta-xylosidase